MRDESNKLFKKMTFFLEKNNENPHALTIFTDYMYKINSHLSKTKRILIVTDLNIYSVNLNLTLVMKIPLKILAKITIIKNSSAVLVLHPKDTVKDLVLETMKRTELIVYLINQYDRLQIERPQIVQSLGLKLIKSQTKQEIIDFDPAKKEDMSKKS